MARPHGGQLVREEAEPPEVLPKALVPAGGGLWPPLPGQNSSPGGGGGLRGPEGPSPTREPPGPALPRAPHPARPGCGGPQGWASRYGLCP